MGWSSVIYGGFIAVALSAAATALALYLVMRQRFLLWFVLRSLAFAVMAVAFIPAPLPFGSPDGLWRPLLGDMAIALAAACAGPFLADLIEPNIRAPLLRRRLRYLFLLGMFGMLILPVAQVAGWVDTLHKLVLVAISVAIVIALASAIRAGSRLARFQAVAWAVLIGVGLGGLAYELVTGQVVPWIMGAVLIALIVEFAVTATGIVDGFMTIKQERDEAVAGMQAATIANATDSLTGIANRRGLERQFADSPRGRPTAVAIFDCDAFKSINDTFGHQTGDKVLIAVAAGLRSEDDLFVARLGGEEFVVLLYTAGWQRRAERARMRVEQAVRDRMPDFERRVTASAGVTEVMVGENLNEALRRADHALYAAKREGRDQTFAVADRAIADHVAYKVA